MLNKELLEEWFIYKEGRLYWKLSPKYDIPVGSLVGSVREDGYISVGFTGGKYLLHRLIFLLFNGYLPDLIDHIDQDHTNNRIENLRASDKKRECL